MDIQRPQQRYRPRKRNIVMAFGYSLNESRSRHYPPIPQLIYSRTRRFKFQGTAHNDIGEHSHTHTHTPNTKHTKAPTLVLLWSQKGLILVENFQKKRNHKHHNFVRPLCSRSVRSGALWYNNNTPHTGIGRSVGFVLHLRRVFLLGVVEALQQGRLRREGRSRGRVMAGCAAIPGAEEYVR